MFAEVKPEIVPLDTGPKLVHLSYHITEGPRVRIRDLEFLGNEKVSDRTLARKMKENKAGGFFGGMFAFVRGGGSYREDKFGEDAEKIVEYYRDRGYITAQVGQPDLQVLEDERDGRTRWVQLRIPVTEGNQYRIGDFSFEGNEIVKDEALRTLFKVQPGDIYSEKAIRKGLEKAREVYGTGGYYEFVGYPDLRPRDMPPMENGADGPPRPGPSAAASNGPPVVDVVMRVNEGKQYFVNRITFTGNTTTRDNVIRREMRLVEAGPFNLSLIHI